MSAGTVSRYLQETAEQGFGWPLPAEFAAGHSPAKDVLAGRDRDSPRFSFG